MNTPDTEMESVEEVVEKSGHVEEACDFAPSARVMHLPYVKKLLQDDRTSRDTYWKGTNQVFVNNIIEDIENMKGVYSAQDAITKALEIIKRHTIR